MSADRSQDLIEGQSVHRRQFLSVQLAGVLYALPIEAVREIRGYEQVTPVPGVQAHVLGVMNLRGQLIPVMDLRRRFGLEARAIDKFTAVVLVQQGERTMGAVVDTVEDVLAVPEDDIRAVPEMNSEVECRFLEGMFVLDGSRVVLILAAEQALEGADIREADLRSSPDAAAA